MKRQTLLSLSLIALFVSGCSQMREELGLNRNSPDEFTVVKRAPLTLPPEYNLRPPGEYAVSGDRSRTAGAQARETIFGADGTGAESRTSANDAFLSQAGVAQADPAIRRVIDEESGYVELDNRSTVDKILNRKPAQSQGVVIDAQKEAERLKQNEQTGAPLNAGDVPIVEE